MRAPTLQPGDIVVMDNRPARKAVGVCDPVEQLGGRLLYLPPYSPDFKPVENACAKLKALLRAGAEHHRCLMGRHRCAPRRLHASRMRKRLRCWI